jgi:hypothetical protein
MALDRILFSSGLLASAISSPCVFVIPTKPKVEEGSLKPILLFKPYRKILGAGQNSIFFQPSCQRHFKPLRFCHPDEAKGGGGIS